MTRVLPICAFPRGQRQICHHTGHAGGGFCRHAGFSGQHLCCRAVQLACSAQVQDSLCAGVAMLLDRDPTAVTMRETSSDQPPAKADDAAYERARKTLTFWLLGLSFALMYLNHGTVIHTCYQDLSSSRFPSSTPCSQFRCWAHHKLPVAS